MSSKTSLARGGRVLFIETSSLGHYDLTRRFYLKHQYEQAATIPDYYADGDHMVVFRKRFEAEPEPAAGRGSGGPVRMPQARPLEPAAQGYWNGCGVKPMKMKHSVSQPRIVRPVPKRHAVVGRGRMIRAR